MNRTLMMILVDADHASDVEQLLEECELPGYSEIPSVLGKGSSGKKFGNRAFPGSSTMYLAAVDGECRPRLAERLRSLRAAKGGDEGLKVYALDTEEIV